MRDLQYFSLRSFSLEDMTEGVIQTLLPCPLLVNGCVILWRWMMLRGSDNAFPSLFSGKKKKKKERTTVEKKVYIDGWLMSR